MGKATEVIIYYGLIEGFPRCSANFTQSSLEVICDGVFFRLKLGGYWEFLWDLSDQLFLSIFQDYFSIFHMRKVLPVNILLFLILDMELYFNLPIHRVCLAIF